MEVTLQTQFLNQECVNRWNYLASGTPAAVSFSFALTNALGAIPAVGVYPVGALVWKIAQIMSSLVSFTVITVKDVYDLTDFYSTPFTTPLIGGQAGDAMPPFNAYGFRSNQTRGDIRRATKRFEGVVETFQASGTIVGAIIPNLEALSQEMTDVQTYTDEGNILNFAPIVVSKEEYDPNPPPAEGNHRAYRYYPTEAEQLEHIADSIVWQHYATVRSQVSRQFGKGR
jgi:hypothetical protein